MKDIEDKEKITFVSNYIENNIYTPKFILIEKRPDKNLKKIINKSISYFVVNNTIISISIFNDDVVISKVSKMFNKYKQINKFIIREKKRNVFRLYNKINELKNIQDLFYLTSLEAKRKL